MFIKFLLLFISNLRHISLKVSFSPKVPKKLFKNKKSKEPLL